MEVFVQDSLGLTLSLFGFFNLRQVNKTRSSEEVEHSKKKRVIDLSCRENLHGSRISYKNYFINVGPCWDLFALQVEAFARQETHPLFF